jgi:Popeye protein conserved region
MICCCRQSILVLRTSLAVGFCVSAFWAALTLCAADMVAWSAILSVVNAAHALRLAVQVLPPRLSPDLLELYERQFGPLKVEKHLFKVKRSYDHSKFICILLIYYY